MWGQIQMAKRKVVKKKKQKVDYTFWKKLIERESFLELTPEHKFGERKFRWDYAVLELNVLIEIQGGIWSAGKDKNGKNKGPGAHGRGVGIMRDMEKLNYASSHGFRCLQYSPEQFCNVVQVVEDLNKCRASL